MLLPKLEARYPHQKERLNSEWNLITETPTDNFINQLKIKIMITTDYISEIMHTVITLQNDNQIFAYLSPHVSSLELKVYVGGWRESRKSVAGLTVYYGDKSYLNPQDIKSQVEKFISKYAK